MMYWQDVVKRLKESGSSEEDLILYELRLYYLYDFLLSLSGKIMILRTPNFATFFLSLLGSAAFRILIRFTSSVLTLRRIAIQKQVHPDATNESLNTVIKATDEIQQDELDSELPIFDCDNVIGPTIMFSQSKDTADTDTSIEPVVIRDSILTQSTAIPAAFISTNKKVGSREKSLAPSLSRKRKDLVTITIESGLTQGYSVHQTIAKVIQETRSSTTESPTQQIPSQQHHSITNIKSFLLDITEQAITILNLDNRTLESIGLDSIASMTSDLFSKAAATIAMLILLTTSSPPFPTTSIPDWSSCNGSLTLQTLAIEILCALLVTMIIEIPYTLYEARDIGYDLRDVVGKLER
ncbi:hypothetical protein HDU76_011521, partial [Blyttiomyces sp. JEL0837]